VTCVKSFREKKVLNYFLKSFLIKVVTRSVSSFGIGALFLFLYYKRNGGIHMDAIEKLKELNISFEQINHVAVYTIEEMDNLGKEIFKGAKICKNLFVRDNKGKNHFLIVMPEEKRAPLSEISEKIGSTKLSFASEERLEKYLKLKPGSVSPLAVINDDTNDVQVVIDEELKKESLLGVHPNVNTSTILLKPEDLEKYIIGCNNKLKYISI